MKTWLITGASRGIGMQIAKSALASGDQVVASARRADAVIHALGESERLVAMELDVADAGAADDAVASIGLRFGRLDVLVNNAGYGQFGAFEEISTTAVERQFATNLFGAFNVTRAALPLMRSQRTGHIIVNSSMSGVEGCPMASIYCASKFALAGWADSLATELAPYNIGVSTLYPGTFSTDFFTPSSLFTPDLQVDDYRSAELGRTVDELCCETNAVGDPAALGRLVVRIANMDRPPRHLAVGSDAYSAFLKRAMLLRDSAAKWRALSMSTDHHSSEDCTSNQETLHLRNHTQGHP